MLLNNIYSPYIIKTIFSHLIDEVKLIIVKYNKKIQKRIDISIINYKIFSSKYIQYESK